MILDKVDLFTISPQLVTMEKIYTYEIPEEMKEEILSSMLIEAGAEIKFEKLVIKVTKNDSKDTRL